MYTNKIIFVFCFFGLSIFSQSEANHWYFGDNAGLDFTSGSPIAVTNGQLSTVEGCASMSDSSGNLLFYTDGSSVYNVNHTKTPNTNPSTGGVELLGDASSTQSAIIIPKPGNSSNYFIFTVDDHIGFEFGLRYSEMDMTLDGGLGDVITNTRNSIALAHSSEKITAVKSNNCNEFWVISFANSNVNETFENYKTFYAFKIDNLGVSSTPIQSTFNHPNGSNINDGRGYLKISPDGSKIAIAHTSLAGNGVLLYDFDDSTGVVSNQTLLNLSDTSNANNNPNTNPYGLEFSIDSSKLYITSYNDHNSANSNTPANESWLWQFDLSNFNVVNSGLIIQHSINDYRSALQLGPDLKIYRSHSIHYSLGLDKLSVINNPNNLGNASNYQHQVIDLNGRLSRQGLPPFIQSLFLPDINIIDGNTTSVTTQLDLCDGEPYRLKPFDISTHPITTTYNWLLNNLPLSPTVTTPFLDIIGTSFGSDNYTLEIEFNDGTSCPFFGKAEVINHPNPVLTPITIRQCDDDNTDGFTAIDLTLANASILTTPIVDETFTYFETLAFAQNGNTANAIPNPTNYITNTKPIWVRVETPFCYTIEQVDLIVSVANATFTDTFYTCDDLTNTSTDIDGISLFDLTQIETNSLLINQFAVAIQPNLTFAYYNSISDAQLQTNAIANPNTYRNTSTTTTVTPERIYIRINNSSNLDCAGLGSDTNLYLDLVVETLPIAYAVNSLQEIRGCDADADGFYLFDTSTIENAVLNLQPNVTLTYFYTNTTTNTLVQIPTAQIIPNFLSETKTITIRATNDFTNDPNGACFNETIVDFIVDVMPIANPVAPLIMCDDKPDETDGMSKFDTSLIESILLQGQTDVQIVYYEDASNIILPSPLPNPFETSTQTIRAEVISTINPTCIATTTIDFEVKLDNPVFAVSDYLLCTNQLPTPLIVSIENPQDAYDYFWENDQGEQIGSNLDFIEITEGGEYTVTATTLTSSCSVTKTFFITESSIPQIETINIFDDSTNNRVSILVSGDGDYEFAIDNGNFVDANEEFGHVFYNILEGSHTIHIIDKNGCTPMVSQDVAVIRFPRFITPNNDAINDHFYVIGGNAFVNSSIYIMDRYGKVMANITGTNFWDGTYLGKKVPKSDYWFYAEFIDTDGKKYERKGHFSVTY